VADALSILIARKLEAEVEALLTINDYTKESPEALKALAKVLSRNARRIRLALPISPSPPEN
jgi:hypothetical protein